MDRNAIQTTHPVHTISMCICIAIDYCKALEKLRAAKTKNIDEITLQKNYYIINQQMAHLHGHNPF